VAGSRFQFSDCYYGVDPGRERCRPPLPLTSQRTRRPRLAHQPHSVISMSEVPRHYYARSRSPSLSPDSPDGKEEDKGEKNEQPTVTISTEVNGRTVAQTSVTVPPRAAYISSACSELASPPAEELMNKSSTSTGRHFSFNDPRPATRGKSLPA